jgi:integrase
VQTVADYARVYAAAEFLRLIKQRHDEVLRLFRRENSGEGRGDAGGRIFPDLFRRVGHAANIIARDIGLSPGAFFDIEAQEVSHLRRGVRRDHALTRSIGRLPALLEDRWPDQSRTTAWRRVKEVMEAANISGTPAMPKGLRHGFGVNAFQSLVPPHLVQRWLGHASLRTTGIYGDMIGPEERAFAERMWARSSK